MKCGPAQERRARAENRLIRREARYPGCSQPILPTLLSQSGPNRRNRPPEREGRTNADSSTQEPREGSFLSFFSRS